MGIGYSTLFICIHFFIHFFFFGILHYGHGTARSRSVCLSLDRRQGRILRFRTYRFTIHSFRPSSSKWKQPQTQMEIQAVTPVGI